MYKGRSDRGDRGYGGDRGNRFDRPRFFAPVKVGEEVEVKIEAVGEKGDGIAKIKGFVIFVPNAKEGETVKVRITKVLRKVGFGEIVGSGGSKSSESSEETMEESGTDESESSETMEEPESSEPSEDSESFGSEEEEY